MKSATRVTALALAAGISLFQLSCGDGGADYKKKIESSEKAPEQPAKAVKKTGTNEKAPEQPTKPVRETEAEPAKKTDAEWRKLLSPEQYYILRKHGTERPWGKAYDEFKNHGEGTYSCAGCGAELFTSKEKFEARCGWPAFYDASRHKNVKTLRDSSGGFVRIEVRCNVCDGHLGHVFEGEGFNTPTDQRYCINGKVLKFVPKAAANEKGEKKPEPKPEKENP